MLYTRPQRAVQERERACVDAWGCQLTVRLLSAPVVTAPAAPHRGTRRWAALELDRANGDGLGGCEHAMPKGHMQRQRCSGLQRCMGRGMWCVTVWCLVPYLTTHGGSIELSRRSAPRWQWGDTPSSRRCQAPHRPAAREERRPNRPHTLRQPSCHDHEISCSCMWMRTVQVPRYFSNLGFTLKHCIHIQGRIEGGALQS